MIDIHVHILPDIDDGPTSMKDSIIMAKTAWQSGVHTMIVTPHCNVFEHFDNYYDDAFTEKFNALKNELINEQIPLEVKIGMEVYATEEVPLLIQRGKIIALNHSRYLLLEFGFQKDLPLIDFLIEEVMTLGLHLIIAHPERYPYVQKCPEIVYDWLERGCYLQVNKGSILGSFGRTVSNTALFLLEHNLVSFIASDAHGPIQRRTDLSVVNIFLERYFSKEYANILLEENPRRVVEDKKLIKF